TPLLPKAATSSSVSLALGQVLTQEKSYGDAEAQLKKAAQLAPSDPAPYVALGEAYLYEKRQGDADAAFQQAAQAAQAASGPSAAYYLGVAQQRLKQYDQAIA